MSSAVGSGSRQGQGALRWSRHAFNPRRLTVRVGAQKGGGRAPQRQYPADSKWGRRATSVSASVHSSEAQKVPKLSEGPGSGKSREHGNLPLTSEFKLLRSGPPTSVFDQPDPGPMVPWSWSHNEHPILRGSTLVGVGVCFLGEGRSVGGGAGALNMSFNDKARHK